MSRIWILVALLLVGLGVGAYVYLPAFKGQLFLMKDLMGKYNGVHVSVTPESLAVAVTPKTMPADSAAGAREAGDIAQLAFTKLVDHEPNLMHVTLEAEPKQMGAIRIRGTRLNYRYTKSQVLAMMRGYAPGGATKTVAGASVTPAGTPTSGSATPTTKAPATNTTKAAPPPVRVVIPNAARRLAASDPTVRWASDSAVVADVDCDNAPDTVMVGRKRGEVHVGLARAADPEPQILVFDVGAAPGSISSTRAAMQVESLDFEPSDRGLKSLEGFRRSTTCKGILLSDGGKKGAHLFWSVTSRHVEWWR